MNTRSTHLILSLVMFVFLVSCAGTEKVAYMQTHVEKKGSAVTQDPIVRLYEVRIKPKDVLAITVVTSESSASRNYNLLMPQISDMSNNSLYGMPSIQTYLVDNDGFIVFPTIGRMHVAGYTRKELEASIQKSLESAFNNEIPIINIRLINYAVNILGEVARPGRYLTTNDRVTIFEGLAMAGDMTIYGRRDHVKVLRENADGSKNLIQVDLRDKDIVGSPAYYLEQNDVVYVEPNNARSRSSSVGTAETLTISAFSIMISLASLVVNILN